MTRGVDDFMEKFKAVILAAGKGTRMHSDLPKVLHKVCDKPMVHYTIQAAKDAGATDVIVIVGYQGQLVKREIVDVVQFAEQHEQLGTGHAVKCAAPLIGSEGDVIVLCGDTPLITADTIRKLYDAHKRASNGVTVLSAILDDPTGYGRIIRDAAVQKKSFLHRRLILVCMSSMQRLLQQALECLQMITLRASII